MLRWVGCFRIERDWVVIYIEVLVDVVKREEGRGFNFREYLV